MPEVEHMDVTPVQVSDQNGKDSFAKQTTLERALEFGCASVCNEPSEQKPVVVQNEQGEIEMARSNGVDEVKLQLPSENATDSFVTEHFDPLSEDGSNRHTGMKSCDETTISVHGPELRSKGVSCGPLEQIHQLCFDLPPSLPVEETKDIEPLVTSSEDKTKDSLIEHSELPPVDISKSILSETDSFPKHITAEQGHAVGSENTLAPGYAKNEIVETGPAVSKCATTEQLESPPETLTGSSLIESMPVALEDSTNVEKLASHFEDNTKVSLIEQLETPVDGINSNLAQTGSCPEQIISEQRHELGSGGVYNEPSEQISQIASEPEPLESETVELPPGYETKATSSPLQNLDLPPGYETKAPSSPLENIELPPGYETKATSSPLENIELPPGYETKAPSPRQEQLAQPSVKDSSFEEMETSPKVTIDYFSPSGSQERKSPKVLKKKHRVKHLVDSDRILRPRSHEKPKPPESSTIPVNASAETKGGKKKKKQTVGNVAADEFLRIRQRLKYFQNKINYEQSLIDAYSGEGWKGLSLEKLKPEKELQRASAEILRQKLRIRDLFQNIDNLCAEGRIPDSLFDSEGEIESEDIFCAKCGSKDVSLDNDIILCDGACERAFHQFCLEPPLRKEDIPPDDEGWLCPGCDCKFDCIDLLNESQGTNLKMSDSWKKVFPEAAATTGQNQDPNFGLPSDDSEDDDYNPDGPEPDEKVQEDASSSDESRYTTASDDLEKPANEEQFLGLPSDDSEDDDFDPSAPDHDDDDKVKPESSSSDFSSDSEDLGAVVKGDSEKPANKEQFLGLPSDDSEDDDYDPNALDHDDDDDDDDKAKPESSSSDFTSDSEDLGAALKEGVPSGKDEDPISSSLKSIKSRRGSDGQSSNVGRKKQIDNELSSLLKSDHGEDVVPISAKRRVERLDYKKLHDEEYGNVSTDSSDDEIWTAKETHGDVSSGSSDDENLTNTAAQRKRKKTTGKVMPASSNGTTPVLEDEAKAKDIKRQLVEPKHTSRKRSRQKMNSEDTNGSPSTPNDKGSLISGCSDKKAKSSAARRLGETATQELRKSFNENQYPDRARQENLAARLELTLQQVNKWFNNARWSARHVACVAPCSASCPAGNSRRKTPVTEKITKLPEPGPEAVTKDVTPRTNTGAPESRPGSSRKDSRKKKGKSAETKNSRKRKGNLGSVESNVEETPKAAEEEPRPGKKRKGNLGNVEPRSHLNVEETPKASEEEPSLGGKRKGDLGNVGSKNHSNVEETPKAAEKQPTLGGKRKGSLGKVESNAEETPKAAEEEPKLGGKRKGNSGKVESNAEETPKAAEEKPTLSGRVTRSRKSIG